MSYFFLICLLLSSLAAKEPFQIYLHEIISNEEELIVPGFKDAYNPSIVETEEGYLLSFRWHPDPNKLWISKIGLWRLNSNLQPLAPPQIVETRKPFDLTPSQSEDARLFKIGKSLYLIYNDNLDIESCSISDRRDMYLSKLEFDGERYSAASCVRLICPEHYDTQLWQKNWVPFVFEGNLFLSYSFNPHEVLLPDLTTGLSPLIETSCIEKKAWKWGTIRGGTPAIDRGDHYLAIFHSWIKISNFYTYYMGAYTFSKEPPFAIQKISSAPIAPFGFYDDHSIGKRVIFPGGIVDKGDFFLIVFGVDDARIFYCSIPKIDLYQTLVEIE